MFLATREVWIPPTSDKNSVFYVLVLGYQRVWVLGVWNVGLPHRRTIRMMWIFWDGGWLCCWSSVRSVKCLSPSTPRDWETNQASGWASREGDACHVWSTSSRFSGIGVRNAIVLIVSGVDGRILSLVHYGAHLSSTAGVFCSNIKHLQSFLSGFLSFSSFQSVWNWLLCASISAFCLLPLQSHATDIVSLNWISWKWPLRDPHVQRYTLMHRPVWPKGPYRSLAILPECHRHHRWHLHKGPNFIHHHTTLRKQKHVHTHT